MSQLLSQREDSSAVLKRGKQECRHSCLTARPTGPLAPVLESQNLRLSDILGHDEENYVVI